MAKKYTTNCSASNNNMLIFFYLMLFVQVSLQMWLSDKKIVREIDYIIVCAALHPWTGFAVTK